MRLSLERWVLEFVFLVIFVLVYYCRLRFIYLDRDLVIVVEFNDFKF